jgi:hypothetical protein
MIVVHSDQTVTEAKLADERVTVQGVILLKIVISFAEVLRSNQRLTPGEKGVWIAREECKTFVKVFNRIPMLTQALVCDRQQHVGLLA